MHDLKVDGRLAADPEHRQRRHAEAYEKVQPMRSYWLYYSDCLLTLPVQPVSPANLFVCGASSCQATTMCLTGVCIPHAVACVSLA